MDTNSSCLFGRNHPLFVGEARITGSRQRHIGREKCTAVQLLTYAPLVIGGHQKRNTRHTLEFIQVRNSTVNGSEKLDDTAEMILRDQPLHLSIGVGTFAIESA